MKTCKTYDDFIPYMVANEPVFIVGVTCDWLLAEQDVLDEVLEQSLGGFETGVATSQGCSEKMLFSDFLERSMAGERGLYAKDIHIDQLLASRPSSTSSSRSTHIRQIYTVPALFRDDWLNWYWQTCRSKDCDDYSFLYVGGPGSFTAMHHDVVCSYSWSVNLRGKKRWTLFPPTSVPALFSSGELVEDARLGHFDASQYPDLSTCERIEVLQERGVCIFVPCGWYHCVENLEPEDEERQSGLSALTVSINRNWFNGFNVMQVWLFLKSELDSTTLRTTRHAATPTSVFSGAAETTFMDRKEWLLHCDCILRANSALGLGDFVELLAARACMMLSCSVPSLDPTLQSVIKTLSPRYYEAEQVSWEDRQLCTMLQHSTCPSLLKSRHYANFLFQGAEAESASVWDVHCNELARVLQDVSASSIATDILNALHQDDVEGDFEARAALLAVAKHLNSRNQ